MQLLRRIFDFYISGSIHVALAVYALVRMTLHFFHIGYDEPMALFAFFGTIVGYNFVKYDELARAKKFKWSDQFRAIVVLSVVSFLATAYYFFHLERSTQLVSIGFLLLTVLYTLPVFPKISNARNWAGVKIYIVAFCWAGVTVILPILNSKSTIEIQSVVISIQRFVLILVLLLIFEIVDLKRDKVQLQTIPQQIGIEKTKLLGYGLLFVFCFIEILNFDKNLHGNFQLFIEIVIAFFIAIVIATFLFFSSPKRSDYYTSFWVESIPVFWWLMVIFWE